jgi:hypothetical protein
VPDLIPATPPEPARPFDEAEFLRRTFDRSLEQMERSRTYFEDLLKRTFWAIGVVLALILAGGGILGFRTWSDIQTRMNSKLSETQAAIEKQGQQAIVDTNKEIHDRAEAAFKQENIKAFVRQVAKEKTESELGTVIKQSVGEQVAARVKAQEPQINSAVVQETKRAVEGLNPYISSEVQKKTNEGLTPFRNQVEAYQEILSVSTSALLARNGNALAYDQITGTAKQATNPAIREICVSTLNVIYLEANSGIYSTRTFNTPKEPTEMVAMLNDPNQLIRWAAVDSLSNKNEKRIVPKLIEIINHDSSLWVREAAYHALQSLTGQNFEVLQVDQWNSWWEGNKHNWPPK